MAVKGTFTETGYIPEPSVARFEAVVGETMASQLCCKCREALGYAPRITQQGQHLHLACYVELIQLTAGVTAPLEQ